MKSSPLNTCVEITVWTRSKKSSFNREVIAFFERYHVKPEEIVLTQRRASQSGCFYANSRYPMKAIQRDFSKMWKQKAILRIRVLKQRDWIDKWKRDYRCATLGKTFQIVPLWERTKCKSMKKTPLFLEPGCAFGSGLHETTRLVIQLMEDLRGRFSSFLDVGTGSGILSIAAEKLGAREIVGIDLDQPSIENAVRNAESNDCRSVRFQDQSLSEFCSTKRFDLVVANLLLKILLEHKRKLAGFVRPRGWLLLSGISIKHLNKIQTGFRGLGLRCVTVLKRRSWVALAYRRVK